MHVLAAHLSSSGSVAAYFLDRVVPGFISGMVVLIAGFFLNRSIKTHVDTSTRRQTAELSQVATEITTSQTAHLAQLTADQTETLSARAAPARTRARKKKTPAPAGDGSARAGGSEDY